jgi:tetratricopeptide (TPR) repeat protein
MKLEKALFREPWQVYRVGEVDEWENWGQWDIQALPGLTLAEENVAGPFEGLFIVPALIVSSGEEPSPIYLDVTLPERIADHHYVKKGDHIERKQGRRAEHGTVIPAIGIEKLGVYKLYFAKENPAIGVDVLTRAIPEARRKQYPAYDLALLLRDQNRTEEAIEAFSIVLEGETPTEIRPILHTLYRERAKLYELSGRPEKATEDKRRFEVAFQNKFGHAPGPNEM